MSMRTAYATVKATYVERLVSIYDDLSEAEDAAAKLNAFFKGGQYHVVEFRVDDGA